MSSGPRTAESQRIGGRVQRDPRATLAHGPRQEDRDKHCLIVILRPATLELSQWRVRGVKQTRECRLRRLWGLSQGPEGQDHHYPKRKNILGLPLLFFFGVRGWEMRKVLFCFKVLFIYLFATWLCCILQTGPDLRVTLLPQPPMQEWWNHRQAPEQCALSMSSVHSFLQNTGVLNVCPWMWAPETKEGEHSCYQNQSFFFCTGNRT